MKMELLKDEWRKGGGTEAVPVPRRRVLVDVRTVDEAEHVLNVGDRVDAISLLSRCKLRALRRLLRAVDARGGDQLEQAFFLGVSETCIRKWRRLLNTESWPPSEGDAESLP